MALNLPASLKLAFLLIYVIFCSSCNGQYPTSRNGPPRFKQNARPHHYAYLGDTAKFKCAAIGRPPPKVHWFFDGRYLNYSFMQANPRFRDKHMMLEIRRVEVSDKGNWMCRVWNNEGSTTRNFTLHIIDFCDYFLNPLISRSRIPEECLCQWAAVERRRETLRAADGEASDATTMAHPFTLRRREDINDLSGFSAAHCAKFEKVEEIAFFPRTPLDESRTVSPIEREGVESTHPLLLPLPSSHNHPAVPVTVVGHWSRQPGHVLGVSSPHVGGAISPTVTRLEAKLELAKELVQKSNKLSRMQNTDADEEEEDYDAEEESADADWSYRHSTPPTTAGWAGAVSTSSRNPPYSYRRHWGVSTTQWPPPPRVPPYFRQMDEHIITNIVLPAGRTLKLACKAGGQPEPQVVWRKGDVEIHRNSESKTGSLYRIRKWTLELEDAAESDSGDYTCEVFNSAGTITRNFRVDVQDRLRSRPIIVPNVLLNQTIDVNNTVNFSCQVISDLTPHVVWIKLVQKDGSYVRWDPTTKQHSFNFVDVAKLGSRVKIYHNNHTRRYTMEMANVTMGDQGIYSCIAGNLLGMSMANATLTVNEFRPMTLPTEYPYSWPLPLAHTILLLLFTSLILLCACLALLYCLLPKRLSKNRIRHLDKLAGVRKKVVITKRQQKEGEIFSDLASTYAITVESVGAGDPLPKGANGSSEALSEYEIPVDIAWEIERSRLQLEEILGEGAFGEVWQGALRPKSSKPMKGTSATPVAVKRLKNTAQEKELIILVSEMQILKSIGQHRNILQLVGCCTGCGPLMVILELCRYGNLRDFLRRHRPKEEPDNNNEEKNDGHYNMAIDNGESSGESEREHTGRSNTIAGEEKISGLNEKASQYQNITPLPPTERDLTLRDLVKFATDIARGMEFLTSKKIIHRDLAARNVLVADDYVMKISDFGLSRNVFYHDYYRKRGAGRLPIKWMAPEALEANVYTVYSDVWSFGIVLWEILTLGGSPYPSIAMPQLYNLLKEGYRMEPPHNCPDEIYSVMVNCWQDKPEQRPQFSTIADYFEWMLQETSNTPQHFEDEDSETEEESYAVINEGTAHKSQDTHVKLTLPFPQSGPATLAAGEPTSDGTVDERAPLLSCDPAERHGDCRESGALDCADLESSQLYMNQPELLVVNNGGTKATFTDSAIGSLLLRNSPSHVEAAHETYENTALLSGLFPLDTPISRAEKGSFPAIASTPHLQSSDEDGGSTVSKPATQQQANLPTARSSSANNPDKPTSSNSSAKVSVDSSTKPYRLFGFRRRLGLGCGAANGGETHSTAVSSAGSQAENKSSGIVHLMQRSRSIDSPNSSSRGASSAASSAESLGVGGHQIEYTVIDPDMTGGILGQLARDPHHKYSTEKR